MASALFCAIIQIAEIIDQEKKWKKNMDMIIVRVESIIIRLNPICLIDNTQERLTREDRESKHHQPLSTSERLNLKWLFNNFSSSPVFT